MEHLVNNRFQHTLHWDEPFPWHGSPITGYTINITNHSNGLVTTDIVRISNESAMHFIHSFPSDGDSCYELDITLSANNRIGESELTVEHTGHPIG